MRIVAIIQARMGSTRLPGKVLAEIGGQSMLNRVVERVRCIPGVGEVVVATTESAPDEAVVQECTRIGAPVFRGSEGDVLDRYYRAAEAYRAEGVVRVSADCPLIDPGESGRVVDAFLAEAADLAANDLTPSYPTGMGTEVMAAAALGSAWRDATLAYERTHVAPYLFQHPERFRLVNVASSVNYSHLRWTVDTSEDLEFVRAVYSRLDGSGGFDWQAVLSLLAREPGLVDLNRHIRQKTLEEC